MKKIYLEVPTGLTLEETNKYISKMSKVLKAMFDNDVEVVTSVAFVKTGEFTDGEPIYESVFKDNEFDEFVNALQVASGCDAYAQVTCNCDFRVTRNTSYTFRNVMNTFKPKMMRDNLVVLDLAVLCPEVFESLRKAAKLSRPYRYCNHVNYGEEPCEDRSEF